MRQIGKAFGIIARAEAREIMMHQDVSAFYAPSECHALVSRGEERRKREARRHAKSISGLSRRAFNRELKAFRGRVLENVINRILWRAYA